MKKANRYQDAHQLLEVDEIIMECFVSLVNESDVWREEKGAHLS